MTRKMFLAGLLTISVSLLGSVVFAQSEDTPQTPAEAVQNSPVFVDSGSNSVENVNNPDIRFGFGGAIAIPGEGGDNASEESAFDLPSRPDLIRPSGIQPTAD